MSDEKTPDVVALDPGTATLLSARKEGDKIVIEKMRNVFLAIRPSPFIDKMLETQKIAKATLSDGQLLILGDKAFEMATTFGMELRRPMAEGFLSPKEESALPVLAAMVERMIGKGDGAGTCIFNVSAPHVDSDMDPAFHREALTKIIHQAGWKSKTIGEGHAVVLSELAGHSFTGISASYGGGTANICIAHSAVPAVEFAVRSSGDWIDQQVARACNIPTPQATEVKESGMDVAHPVGREEEAVAAYVKEMIRRTLMAVDVRFRQKKDAPRFKTPSPFVLAGGTVLIKGFLDVFKACLFDTKLPFKVGDVWIALDPLTSVVRGNWAASQLL